MEMLENLNYTSDIKEDKKKRKLLITSFKHPKLIPLKERYGSTTP